MKRKYAIVLLSIVMVLSLVLVACQQEHTYSEEWSYDETHHWHAAICEHADEKSDYAEHDMQNGKCSVCGYTVGGGGTGGEANGFKWSAYSSGSGSFGDSSASGLPEVPSGKADKPSIQIHYRRTNASEYSKWSLWLWTKSGSVGSDEPGWSFNYRDDYGVVALYSFEQLGSGYNGSEALGFIVRQANWAAKDIEADRFWSPTAGEIDENNYYHLYLTQGDPGLYTSPNDIQYGMTASFQSTAAITVTTKSAIKHIGIYEGGTLLAETDTTDTANITYTLPQGKSPDLSKEYTAKVTFVAGDKEKEIGVSMISLYGTDLFNETYYYDGELGALYTQDATEFKVWSPVSTKIVLNLYESGNGGSAYKTYDMVKGDRGVWSVKVDGDLAAKYYTYTVTNSSNPVGTEIVDPYAKSAGLNGKRGQIVNFAETNPEGWDEVQPLPYKRNELVVWETHVADVTSSATWGGKAEWSKKFLGMAQEGTTYTEKGVTVKTGFDHIKELGVNAVQLVPIFDQDNNEAAPTFNWGYNPLNYNVLEGAYSTDASDGYVRVREFKQLVQAFNGAGINIIMDVVYNHVSAAVGSNFDVLMPGYYYRYTTSGDMANGSGCGNETASDHLMFRKFMIDSVKFWASEYKLGGFRFDLMGLHDVETMNQLTAELKKINPDIVVYGEPWEGGTTPLSTSQQADQANGNKFVGFGQFNDKMRDALIKGGMAAASENSGWAMGAPSASNSSAIVAGLKGFTAASPAINDLEKSINYVTCHDNYTLRDRLWATNSFRQGRDNKRVEELAMLANSVVLTSNGVNFILAGEEFLRSKQENGATGDAIHNSYESSYKVNELSYNLKITYNDVFQNYVKLIAFKRMFVDTFGIATNDDVSSRYSVQAVNNGSVIEITINAKDGTVWKVIHANESVGSGYNVDLAGYELYLDTLNVEGLTLTSATPIQQRQTIIASK